MKASPEDSAFADLPFPVKGLDVSTEYATQRQQTAARASNVRAFEPGTNSARGGARCGHAKWIGSRVNGAHPVQLLDVVVDPTTPALLFGDAPGDTLGDPSDVPDPSTNNTFVRNPGRFVRPGGSGVQPSRNTRGHGHATPDIEFVQQSAATEQASGADTLVFGTVPLSQSLLVLLIATEGDGSAVSAQNAFGNTYTLAGSAHSFSNFGVVFGAQVLYREATAGTFEKTVTVDPGGTNSWYGIALEYKNVKTPSGSAPDGSAGNADSGFPTSWTCTNCAVSGPADLVVGLFVKAFGTTAFTFGAGITERANHTQTGASPTDISFYAGDKLPAAAAFAIAGTISGGGEPYAGAAASFFRK